MAGRIAAGRGLAITYKMQVQQPTKTFCNFMQKRLAKNIAFLSVLIQVLLGEGEEKALSASIIIKIIIFSPVLEELFNRCAVITILKTILKADNVVYMLISAVIFAMFHINSLKQSGFMQEISNLLIYFILGMGCAYVYLRTNNIVSAIVLHMFWNVSIVGGIISDIAHR